MVTIATFNGKHNQVKTDVMLTLDYFKNVLGMNQGITLHRLAILTGAKYTTLHPTLSRWMSYKKPYVTAKPVVGETGKPCFAYEMAAKGKRFLTHVPLSLKEHRLSLLKQRWQKLLVDERSEE